MAAPSTSWRQHVAVAAAFTLIALAQTWPLVTQLTTALPNDPGDPVLNTWILWWNAHAVPLTTRWWDAPMFYPARGALAFSEVLLGLSVVATPLQWLGASPIVAYNLLFLASFPLSAFCTYLLAWTLTHRAGPSIVAGIMFGFSIFRFAHVPQIQILWSWWMPLALVGLHRSHATAADRVGGPGSHLTAQRTRVGGPGWMTERRRSGLVLFAIGWLGQSLSNGYYFFYFSIIVALWLAWFTRWREAQRVLLPALIAWAAAGLLLAPVLLTYRQVQGRYQFARSVGEIESGGADLTEFFRPSSIPRFLGVARWERGEHEVSLPLIGIAALTIGLIGGARGGLLRLRPRQDTSGGGRRPPRPQTARRESILWIAQIALWTVAAACALIALSTRTLGNWHFDALGVHVSGIAKMLAVALPAAILGLALSPSVEKAWRARAIPAFYLGSTCVAIVMAMGPNPRAWGERFWHEAPYAWLMAIAPGVDGLRVPARFTLIAVLCTAIFTALLLARIHLAHAMRERLLFGSVAMLALLETWPPPLPMASLPTRAPDVGQDGTVIELPFGGEQELPSLYRSMFHQRPIVNGYSGYFPLSHMALRVCLSHPDPECLTTLRDIVGPLDIVIERQHDPDGVWQKYASRLPDAQVRVRTPEFLVYHIPGTATSQNAFEHVHVPIKSVHATARSSDVALALDGNWRTEWSTGRGQATNDALTIETERAPIVGVELWLNPSSQHNYPRGLVIETSEDGDRWARAWEGSTEQALFTTLLASGLPGTRIMFPPRPARFVRLTETLNEAGTPWSIVELTVLRAP